MYNVKIAIIEHNQMYAMKVKVLLNKMGINDIDNYIDPLCYIYSSLKYDIVFISTELDNFEYFVRKRRNYDKLFIYMISSDVLLNITFGIDPFRILIKSQIEVELVGVLSEVMNYLENTYLTFYIDRRKYNINMNHVVLIYSEGHYLNFAICNTILRVRKSFKEIEKQMNFNKFIRAKYSYYINFHHISNYNKSKLVLDNGMSVDLSRYGYKEILENTIKVELSI